MDNAERQRQIEEWLERFKQQPGSFYCEIIRAWMNKERCLCQRSKSNAGDACYKCSRWGGGGKKFKRVEKKKDGRIGRAPFGYQKIGNELYVNPEEIETLQALVRYVEDREGCESLGDVARKLNRDGYRRRDGSIFCPTSVRNLFDTYQRNKKKKKFTHSAMR